MLRNIILTISILLFSLILKGQDTLYIYKSGNVVVKMAISDIDSMVFTQPNYPILLKDIEGNSYSAKNIGGQIWMTENLRVTKFNNGDDIPTIKGDVTGFDLTGKETKFQWAYNDDENNVSTYGRLYTWYAATDSRNVCPQGWHLPSSADWNALIQYLADQNFGVGGVNNVAKALASVENWKESTENLTVGKDSLSNNTAGFNAQPNGIRTYQSFDYKGYSAYWWTANERNSSEAYVRSLHWNRGYESEIFSAKISGAAVRCIKNN